MKIKILCLLAIAMCFSCTTDDSVLEENTVNMETSSGTNARQSEISKTSWIYFHNEDNFSQENYIKIKIEYNNESMTEFGKSFIREQYTNPFDTDRSWYLTAVEVISSTEEYWYWGATNCPDCTGGVSDIVALDPNINNPVVELEVELEL